MLLFGDEKTPPLWLWLAIEREELAVLEAALLDHLRSPLFPSRIGEGPLQPGDDAGLLEFALRFGTIAGRFAQGSDLVLAATRIVTERGGPLARQGAMACVEALQYRLHAEARSLGAAASNPARLRHFVLGQPACCRSLAAPRPGAGQRPAAARGSPMRSACRRPRRRPPSWRRAAGAARRPPGPGTVTVLQPFEPPNDRAEWLTYQALAAPLPLRRGRAMPRQDRWRWPRRRRPSPPR